MTATRGERGRFGDSKSPGPEIVGKTREAELLAAARAGIREVRFPRLSGWGPRSGRRDGSDLTHRERPSATGQAPRRRHRRSRQERHGDPDRHRHQPADPGTAAIVRRRSRFDLLAAGRRPSPRVQALPPSPGARKNGRVPGGAAQAGGEGGWRGTAGRAVAGLGHHHRDRYQRGLADRLARRVLPQDPDVDQQAARGAAGGAPARPLGNAGVLPRPEPRQWRSRTEV